MTSNGNSQNRDQIKSSLDLHSAGIMAALKRAAIKAQRRAIEVSGSVAIYRDGKIIHVTEVPDLYEEETDRV